MCIQVVERYAVCRCIYHRHSLDPCAAYGSRSHGITERIVFVGYKCPSHTNTRQTALQHNARCYPSGSNPPGLGGHFKFQ
ncbi:unnamed protein product [Aureobasidium pullulans]|nr:unnamed protein product [Aureobasidium pullulans]CAD0015260.1 unnamed protein product [Aureobasidium pullulans]CAD0027003.1 unnamed protein product [Aureobasidium pullulans]CAD0046808.1 unnamed protein product [Aureobasidium pullulans]CAD0054877.1 unnamed protein product [Aureobasidium pullulans]